MEYSDLIKSYRVLKPPEPEFPSRLLDTPGIKAIRELYIVGNAQILKNSAIGIVGTRSPDGHGIVIAEKLAALCARNNITVISGGASGIDSAVHKACINSGGTTIVVLPGGFKKPYPSSNRALFTKIIESRGALVTEHPPELAPKPFSFLRRNRIIAALSSSVVIIQARFKSGAMSTAIWAQKLGVKLFAVGGSPLNPLYSGNNKLIREGKAQIVDALTAPLNSINSQITFDMCDESFSKIQNAASSISLSKYSETEKKILELLSTEPLDIEEIASITQLSIQQLTLALSYLELHGEVLKCCNNSYILNNHNSNRRK